MFILNSFDDDKGGMKIPNVVVNGISVFILSLQGNLTAPEGRLVYVSIRPALVIKSPSRQVSRYRNHKKEG